MKPISLPLLGTIKESIDIEAPTSSTALYTSRMETNTKVADVNRGRPADLTEARARMNKVREEWRASRAGKSLSPRRPRLVRMAYRIKSFVDVCEKPVSRMVRLRNCLGRNKDRSWRT
jgi:hypothetical protein